uniref:Uncharacterized protein n=1 Tax=Periophthalmus magnuspinnatus TaxID=409849 RepID=A0A3B4B1R9_9GOBI
MDSASSASSSPPASPPPAASPPPPDPREEPADLKFFILFIPVVQLTWMAYDMVAVRTNPELVTSLQKLRDAYQRFKATVLGE